MLQELRIKDFAIIDELTLCFTGGFVVITGETGAGKSIIVDAVNLMLGERSDATLVRGGADRAVIEGTFSVPAGQREALQAYLEAEGLDGESPDEVVLTREVRSNGRSQARINGVTCNLSAFREVGGRLVDIHGQGEHLSLLRPSQHLYLLDRYAGLEDERQAVRGLVRELGRLRREIASLQDDEAAIARRIDMLQYQVQEIEATDPRPEEEAELQQERTRLVNAEKIAELTNEALFLLQGDTGEPSGTDLLAQAAMVLDRLARIDSSLGELAEMAETISVQADELARGMRVYADELEFEPHRLDQIEERVEALTRLKRKYGGSIEAVLAHAEQARAELDAISHSEERLAELRAEEDRVLHAIGDAAQSLSEARRDAAERLTRAIVGELDDLRLQDARFEVRMEQVDDPDGCYVGADRVAFSDTGIDQIEFFMAANIGEPLRPLAKVASGGEAARIMLALKSVLSEADQVPTLIFDEVDQGIGGRMGAVLGQKLWQLSGHHQVLVVTHLAQLAGFGDVHYKVDKQVHNARTVTRVEQLDDAGRVRELAEMLGAETASTHQSAYDILMLARRAKDGRRLTTETA